MILRILIALMLLTKSGTVLGQGDKPSPERIKADAKLLDELNALYAARPDFDERFWRASSRVANARGPVIIHALMDRAQHWKSEEALIYVPLVALLPREPTLKLLKQYERSRRESDKAYAREFQSEIEMDDVTDAARKYSR